MSEFLTILKNLIKIDIKYGGLSICRKSWVGSDRIGIELITKKSENTN